LNVQREAAVGLNVTTTKKVRQIFGGKVHPQTSTPEKILATRMKKGPRLMLVWGPRMVNPEWFWPCTHANNSYM